MGTALRAAALAAGSLCLAAAVFPQEAPPRPPQFRTGIELVQVDVSVLDRDRHPVRGLAASDFTVLEDDVRQEIVSFTEISIPDSAAVSTPWMREVAPDVRTNAAASDRLIVLLLDDAQIRMDARMTAGVKEIGRRTIDRLGPSDLAAVLFTRDNSGAQPFTSDRARLLQAVGTFAPGGLPGVGRDWSNQYWDRSSLETLRLVAENLAQAHERRKALIYVSTGVSVGADQFRIADMQEIFRGAQRGNVNVYCIDPAGLEVSSADDAMDFNRATEFLRQLADGTGGFAVIDRNDFAEGVPQIFRENGSYYLVGYRSSNPAPDGRFRRIAVRVNRPGVTVRTRNGYVSGRAEVRSKLTPRAKELVNALSSVAPERGVAMQITAAPFAIPGKKQAAIAVVLTLRQPLARDAQVVPELADVVVGAYGVEGGRPAAVQRLKTDAIVKQVSELPLQYELLAQLDVRPGRYQLRAAAHSPVEGRSGSIHYDVEVPDFSKALVSLSGVVISAAPSTLAAPKDRFAALLPVVPTARRDFRRTDRAAAFLRVYQRAKGPAVPVAMAARIVSSTGANAFDTTETIRADQFNTARAAEYAVHLPVDRLAPGPYLLTIEARLGKNAARRDVRFVVH